MAVEAMVRHGHDREVHAWIDWYQDRLEDLPRGLSPVTREDWREALGEAQRLGDWTAFMLREVQLRPWRELLAEWWPRLLPGIAAGATHGVIRVGHSVRALLAEESEPQSSTRPRAADATHTEDGGAASSIAVTDGLRLTASKIAVADGPRIAEFAHALAYWAARWKPLNVATPPRAGRVDASTALAGIPSVPEQAISVSHRLSQLSDTVGWSSALGALHAAETPQQAAELLGAVADAAVLDYLVHGHGGPVMLVHASTAPTAALRTLPALPESLWIPSLDAAWLATAAVTAAYRDSEAPAEEVAKAVAQTGDGGEAARETFDRAVRHKDEHAVKFADAALDSFARTGSKYALAAATRATLMIKEG